MLRRLYECFEWGKIFKVIQEKDIHMRDCNEN